MKAKKHLFNLFIFLLALIILPSYGTAQFVEPNMLDYTNYPIFQLNSQQPNIMIILDNSGSMNYNAYGTPMRYGDDVPEGYDDPANCTGEKNTAVTASNGDSEQYADTSDPPWFNGNDLDLGNHEYLPTIGSAAIAGIQFQTVDVPRDRTIENAYIRFTPYEDSSENCTLTIYGQANGDAPAFTNTIDELKNINKTSAFVSRVMPQWTLDNTDSDNNTLDVTAIVQELVNRSDWASGNSMAFVITGTGKRNAYPYDTDPDKAPQLYIDFEATDDDCSLYYGYFDSGTYVDGVYTPSMYTYGSNIFERDASGDWDGNWLNWVSTRRMDVLRKVLVGGKLLSAQGGGATQVLGENQAPDIYYFDKWYNTASNPDDVTAHDGNYRYRIQPDGEMDVYNSGGSRVASYVLKVQKYPDLEPEEFNEDGDRLEGVMQIVDQAARWGNMWFNNDSNKGTYDGGDLKQRIMDGNLANMIADLRNEPGDGATPLAETLVTAMYYFMQVETPIGTKLVINDQNDPYVHDQKGVIPCAKSFVLLLTDGASTADIDIPDYLKNTDGDDSEDSSVAECSDTDLNNFPSGDCYRAFDDFAPTYWGSDYLDDVAYYARTTDLRSDTVGKNALDGDQNLLLYTVYAFDDDPKARALLKDAAINGGFEDMDGDNKPDIIGDPRGGQWGDLGHNKEWDGNGDGSPDNYYEAKDGRKLKDQLLRAINDILNRTASGTAVSVLATRGEGEGTLTQAFFKPAFPTLNGDIKWLGFLQMLWVDQFGNLREDSDGNKTLDIYQDKIIRFFLDTGTGANKVIRYTPDPDNPYSLNNTTYETVLPELITPLWEAGEKLSETLSGERTIFTYLHDNSTYDFTLDNAADLKPYLGVEDNTVWGVDAGLGATEDNRVNNIINFIRGADESEYEGSPSLRQRTLDNGNIWKLGDIVNSTPVTVAKPTENYGSIYDDPSYWTYYNSFVNPETVVYVGANDGMLHAFTAGTHNPSTQSFEAAGGTAIGGELWGYIPRSLLPHLKWLPQNGYTHVSYVDLNVNVTDAKIFTPSLDHPEGWGSVLIGGLNLGGKDIPTQNAGDFKPSVFLIDVTDPRSPQVLWEKSFDNLGLSTNTPVVIRTGGKWKLVITSGPTDFDYDELSGEMEIFSDQYAHVYILDMLTGNIEQDYSVQDVASNAFNDSYLSSPVAFDKELNYNVDSIFMGCTYNNNANGAIFKVTVPQDNATFSPFTEDEDYQDNASTWTDNFKLFALAPAPVTAPFNMSIDLFDNVWLYGGTGRYMDQPDKTNETQNYLFGIKDPFFNQKYETEDENNPYKNYVNEASIPVININDTALFDADPYTIRSTVINQVSGGISGINTWKDLVVEARDDNYDGWIRSLCEGSIANDGSCNTSGPSERLLKQPSILGGIVLYPTFSPSSDVCGFGGNGRLWALYYETGTAFKRYIFGDPAQEIILDVMYLGAGISSSFGIHIGRQEGATIFSQMSTGIVLELNLNIKSDTILPTYWKNYIE